MEVGIAISIQCIYLFLTFGVLVEGRLRAHNNEQVTQQILHILGSNSAFVAETKKKSLPDKIKAVGYGGGWMMR